MNYRINVLGLLLILLVACGSQKNPKSENLSDSGLDFSEVYVGMNGGGELDCSAFGLAPSCQSVNELRGALREVAVVSGGAAFACAVLPDPVVSKGLAVGFAVIGAQSKFVSFVLGRIPCDKSKDLTKEEKDAIGAYVRRILDANGVEIEGELELP